MSFVVAGAVIGIGAGVGGYLSNRKAQRTAESRERRSRDQMEKYRESYSGMDITNPYADMQNQFAGMQNQFAGMENTMEDLTVNQQQAQFESQQFQQSQANIMDSMRGAAGGSGIAAVAQSLAGQGQLAAQRSSASIGQQESANQRMMAQEAGRLQQMERQGAMDIDLRQRGEASRLDMAGAQGELQRQQREEGRASNLMQMYAGEAAGYGQQATSANQAKWGSIGSIGQSVTGLSDRRFKKNINLIGESPSGLKIYTFEYINETLGKGVYQGVMSDEIPSSAVITKNGCDFVDYSKIDVEFKNLS